MDNTFGNIKCKYCGNHINPINMHDHLLVCKLETENKRLKKINTTLYYFSEEAKIKLQTENKKLREALKMIAMWNVSEPTSAETAIEALRETGNVTPDHKLTKVVNDFVKKKNRRLK